MSKLDFSAVYGHQEHSPAPEAPAATPPLDFSKIAGWRQESPAPNPDEATEESQTATAPWQPRA